MSFEVEKNFSNDSVNPFVVDELECIGRDAGDARKSQVILTFPNTADFIR